MSQPNFTFDQAHAEVSSLTVTDAVTALQLITRYTKSGVIEPQELLPLGFLRANLVRSVQATTGINYDNPQASTPVTPVAQPSAPAATEEVPAQKEDF